METGQWIVARKYIDTKRSRGFVRNFLLTQRRPVSRLKKMFALGSFYQKLAEEETGITITLRDQIKAFYETPEMDPVLANTYYSPEDHERMTAIMRAYPKESELVWWQGEGSDTPSEEESEDENGPAMDPIQAELRAMGRAGVPAGGRQRRMRASAYCR
jgi:hypothetical protein